MIIFIFRIFFILSISLVFLIFLLSFYISSRMLNFKKHSDEEIYQKCRSRGEFPEDFDELPKWDFKVYSPHGYPLKGFFIPGNSTNTVLFSHGYGGNRFAMVKFMHSFLRKGWNIAVFDYHRRGKGKKTYFTHGIFETRDLRAVAEEVFRQFPETNCFGLFGTSMGASIVLNYASMNPEISFVIADCAYSDLFQVMKWQLAERRLPGLAAEWLVRIAMSISYLRTNLRMDLLNKPIDAVKKIRVPILFTHGKKDKMVPFQMSMEMAGVRSKEMKTMLFLQDGAGHGLSIIYDRNRYEEALWSFLGSL